jgi:hypothetical protein
MSMLRRVRRRRAQKRPKLGPQKHVFGACCKAVLWNRKRDGLDIELVPHSALKDETDDAGGPPTL